MHFIKSLFFIYLNTYTHHECIIPFKKAEPQTRANENRTPSKDIAIARLDFKIQKDASSEPMRDQGQINQGNKDKEKAYKTSNRRKQ
jgi:hypothetical protein